MASKHLVHEEQNFIRLSVAGVSEGRALLEEVLRSQIPPEDLLKKLQTNTKLLSEIKHNKLIQEQLKLSDVVPDYQSFDVTLLYKLIRNLCPALQPSQGWGRKPSPTDIRIGDDIERLRIFLIEMIAHFAGSSCVPDDVFYPKWKELRTIFKRMQVFLSSKGSSKDISEHLGVMRKTHFDWQNFAKSEMHLLLARMNLSNAPKLSLQGDERKVCGEMACFEISFGDEDMPYDWPITWKRIKGNTTEQLDITTERYKGSLRNQLVIPRVSKEDEGEYQATLGIFQEIHSNTINLTVTEDTREAILQNFKKWLHLEYKDVRIVLAYIGTQMPSEYPAEGEEDVIVVVIDGDKEIDLDTFMSPGGKIRVVWKLWRYPSFEGRIVSDHVREKEKKIPEEKQKQFEQYLKTHSETLFKRHSNLEIISVSACRSKNEGEEIVDDPCIVFYCSCKGIVPCSEEEFPKEVDGIKTDVREGFFYLFPNGQIFEQSTNVLDPLRMGASIGRESQNSEGTLGGFVTLSDGQIGAITCWHVLFDECTGTIRDANVVQPSYGCYNSDEICGKHEMSVSPSITTGNVTLDVSLIRLTNRIPQRGLFANLKANALEKTGFTKTRLPVYSNGATRDYLKEHQNRFNVCIKCGTSTGLSRGVLNLFGLTARNRNIAVTKGINQSKTKIVYQSQLEVLGTAPDPFSIAGDSGSLVFQIDPPTTVNGDDELFCIGMIVGGTSYKSTILTPIQPILDALNVRMHVFPP